MNGARIRQEGILVKSGYKARVVNALHGFEERQHGGYYIVRCVGSVLKSGLQELPERDHRQNKKLCSKVIAGQTGRAAQNYRIP
jgi:hypothetical protein